jgi:hypothetical protein
VKRRSIGVGSHALSAVLILLFVAGRAGAQSIEVVGTGNPDIDVPAVQTAVDQGGQVTLAGHFSFDKSPTVLTALASAGYPPATIRVSKSVSISGVGEEDDGMSTIDAGTIPFYVEAPGASVTIQRLRFIRPNTDAILVYAVNGLAIVHCKIEGVVPGTVGSTAIDIDTSGNPPTPALPGHPENISGRLLITKNNIDLVGGSAVDNTVGILVFSVGQSPDREADIYVSGNRITNTTEPAINFRRIAGRAYIEGNVINTGPVSSQKAPRPEAIRIVNTGFYAIAHNTIDCQWPDPEAMGIGVFSQFAEWPMEHAVVMDNDVTMSPPTGTVFGVLSAGIDVRGFAQNNVVANNRIRGRARAALSVESFKGGIPSDNTFALNRFDDFEPSLADMFVGGGVTNTQLIDQKGTVDDLGINTVILPF